ncbi:MAG: hypothetical protein ACRDFQ_04215, partial [Anaerolineales bacterium]
KPQRSDRRFILGEEEEKGWTEIEKRLSRSRALTPRRGFCKRWLARWEHQQERARRARGAWLVVGNGAAAVLLLGLLAASLQPLYTKPSAFVAFVVNSMVSVFTFALILFEVVVSILLAVPPLVWMLFGMALFTALAISTLLIKRLAFEGELR